jgi:hypothetical protein
VPSSSSFLSVRWKSYLAVVGGMDGDEGLEMRSVHEGEAISNRQSRRRREEDKTIRRKKERKKRTRSRKKEKKEERKEGMNEYLI